MIFKGNSLLDNMNDTMLCWYKAIALHSYAFFLL